MTYALRRLGHNKDKHKISEGLGHLDYLSCAVETPQHEFSVGRQNLHIPAIVLCIAL